MMAKVERILREPILDKEYKDVEEVETRDKWHNKILEKEGWVRIADGNTKTSFESNIRSLFVFDFVA